MEEALNETKLRYGMQVEQFNGITLLRESEFKQLRANIQSQTLEYQALFNIKMELEAEIATYRRLPGWRRMKVAFILFDTSQKSPHQTLVDRIIVSSSSKYYQKVILNKHEIINDHERQQHKPISQKSF